MKEDYNMLTPYLSKLELYLFSKQLSSKGLWIYSTGDEYRLYINSNHLIKDKSDIYKFSPLNATDTNAQKLTLSATVIYYLMFFSVLLQDTTHIYLKKYFLKKKFG